MWAGVGEAQAEVGGEEREREGGGGVGEKSSDSRKDADAIKTTIAGSPQSRDDEFTGGGIVSPSVDQYHHHCSNQTHNTHRHIHNTLYHFKHRHYPVHFRSRTPLNGRRAVIRGGEQSGQGAVGYAAAAAALGDKIIAIHLYGQQKGKVIENKQAN